MSRKKCVRLPLISICCTLLLLSLVACQTQAPYARLTYTPAKLKIPKPVTDKPVYIARFFDMRGQKTGLMTPESRKRQVVGILCNEDLGNWVTNATFKELQSRGYSAKLANEVDVPTGEFVVGGSVHMVEFERGGHGFYFKVLVDVNVKYNDVIILHRQYIDSVRGKPSLPGTSKSFEKSLRGVLSQMMEDLEPLLPGYEGKQV